MNNTDERPNLEFFRTTPEDLMLRPPLCSSLQNMETSFFLIALGRFPHALVACASAIESAMKSALVIDPEEFINANKLYAKAINHFQSLSSFDKSELESFRFTRNRFAHYGFSPRDDEESAVLLLRTGYPFLIACYKEFFGFDISDGLVVELSEQFGIAVDVYAKAKSISGLHFSYCFLAFSHLIRWSVRQSLMSGWENIASIHADEIGAKFDHCEKQKNELERLLGTTWVFDCPICNDIDTFVCEIDQDQLDDHIVSLTRGVCSSCGLFVPKGCPFLVDALCREQIDEKCNEILRDFGIIDG
jgi:hypothetical protein